MSEDTGTPDNPLPVPAAIRKRRTTRSFRPDPIPDALLRQLIELAVAAPSSWNFQPWRIVVVRDEERKERLCQACWNQGQVRDAPAVFVFAVSHSGWRDTLDEVLEQAATAGAWEAPFVEFVRGNAPGFQEGLGEQLREYNTKDALIAATHLALAAESLGLNSSFMNGYMEDPVKEIIGAGGNDDIGICLVMPIGYADRTGQNPGRLPLERNVFAEDLEHPWTE